ncbi:MAG TPA: hypothetical protein VLS86_07630 [Acidimicrobiia bacterium]|nr:hypothetical protein [Acidimicrobiia bacterium]
MTLEQRLSEALHEVDRFEPSPDLFARVERSLDEDATHRRRVRVTWLAAMASLTAIVVFLGLLVRTGATGLLVFPVWGLELLETVILVSLIFVLAPVISRFGDFYVADVFRLDPGTGKRFMRLLEIAYYLVFLGGVLQGVHLTRLGRVVRLGPGLETMLEGIAELLLFMGVFHAMSLFGLPVVGLVFSSVVRRAERQRAGSSAPPISSKAQQADRIASWVVQITFGLVLLGALVALIGGVVSIGFDS